MSNEKQGDTVRQAMKIFAEEYPGKFSVTDSRVKIWRQMLRDFSSETILASAYNLASTRKDWPPDIATMREQCAMLKNGELSDPSPSEAWGKILRIIAGKSEYSELSGLEKEALKQVGDLYYLRRSEHSGIDRNNFIKAFESLVSQRRVDRCTLPEVKALAAKNTKQLLPPAPRELPQGEIPVKTTTVLNPMFAPPKHIENLVADLAGEKEY